MEIFSRRLLPGEKLPSVREYALLFDINPNTMQRALSELESQKLIYTERTNGKFVTIDADIIEASRIKYADNIITEFFSALQEIGLSKKEVIKIIKEQ